MKRKGDLSYLVSQFLNETLKESMNNIDKQLIESDLIGASELNRSNSILSKSSIRLEEDKIIEKKLQESLKLKDKNKGKLIESERMEIGRVNKKVYWEYLKAMKISRYLLVILSYLASHAFNVASQLWLSNWSNDSNDPNNFNNTKLRNTRLIGYAGFGSAELIFVFCSTFIVTLSCLSAAEKIHNLMLINVFEAPMSFFDCTPQGNFKRLKHFSLIFFNES